MFFIIPQTVVSSPRRQEIPYILGEPSRVPYIILWKPSRVPLFFLLTPCDYTSLYEGVEKQLLASHGIYAILPPDHPLMAQSLHPGHLRPCDYRRAEGGRKHDEQRAKRIGKPGIPRCPVILSLVKAHSPFVYKILGII